MSPGSFGQQNSAIFCFRFLPSVQLMVMLILQMVIMHEYRKQNEFIFLQLALQSFLLQSELPKILNELDFDNIVTQRFVVFR